MRGLVEGFFQVEENAAELFLVETFSYNLIKSCNVVLAASSFSET